MRDYGIVSPQFWIGATGKALRGNADAQVLALYLMTSPHANMIGVYHCPVIYMAHETGLTPEGASKALASLSEVGFCTYEEASEVVFVARMAAYQIGESLAATDNRVKSIQKDVAKITSASIRQAFIATYSVAFHLAIEGKKKGISEAPPKPLRSQEQEQDQEQEQLPPTPKGVEVLAGFAEFWEAWPSGDRKQAKGKCLEAWKKAKAEPDAALVLAHVSRMMNSREWSKNGGEFIPAPLVYLNQKRWDGANDDGQVFDQFRGAI